MRLFTAIELSDEARASIEAEQRRLAARLEDNSQALRFVRGEHLHLTLVFVGEIPESRGAALVEAMGSDIPVAPFHLVFGGIGTYPSRGAPRVLWLGALEGIERIVELHADVARCLARVGVPIEQRPFSPHLTLARWRSHSRGGRPRLPDAPEAVARIDVERVTLFQSRLSSAGPTYTALAHARLRCP